VLLIGQNPFAVEHASWLAGCGSSITSNASAHPSAKGLLVGVKLPKFKDHVVGRMV
jgi:hypothetical protein